MRSGKIVIHRNNSQLHVDVFAEEEQRQIVGFDAILAVYWIDILIGNRMIGMSDNAGKGFPQDHV
jgi:hypothetical protein